MAPSVSLVKVMLYILMPDPGRIVSVKSINCILKGMKYTISQLEVWDAIITIARKHMMNSMSSPRNNYVNGDVCSTICI